MAKKKNIFKRAWHWLTNKHRLSLRGSEDSPETPDRWYIFLSPWHVFAGFTALVVVMFLIVLMCVAYTSILDMIPGYPGGKSREMLVKNIMKLDSLSNEMNNLLVYSDNISLIMDGKTPVVRNVAVIGDSLDVKSKKMVKRSATDQTLRDEIEGSGEYSIAAAAAAQKKSRNSLDLQAPVHGVKVDKFSPKNGHFGITIATAANTPVAAVKGGTVVTSYWSPEDGYVISVQHSDNLVSTYKHNTTLQKSIGDRVRQGEIIATAGEDKSTESGGQPFEFELWYNGTPIDPESYIVF